MAPLEATLRRMHREYEMYLSRLDNAGGYPMKFSQWASMMYPEIPTTTITEWELKNVSVKPVAHIEDWVKVGNCLMGTVSGHPRQGEFYSETQRTSALVRFDRTNKEAETRNTFYTLGRELPNG